MSTAVLCDVCGKAVAPEESKFIKVVSHNTVKIFDVSVYNTAIFPAVTAKDLCDECYAKVLSFLDGTTNDFKEACDIAK